MNTEQTTFECGGVGDDS